MEGQKTLVFSNGHEFVQTASDKTTRIELHCQSLFDPPINVVLLVKAAAQGLSIDSVLNDLNTLMPNYRFYYLLQKGLELCNELKSLGGAMLSAIEKKDNETIALIRAKHEGVMQNLVMEIRKKQVEEAQKNIDSLRQNRSSQNDSGMFELNFKDERYLPFEGAGVQKIQTGRGNSF